MKMATLKQIFEALKLAEVETFIASGNVIFASAAGAGRLELLIEAGLRKALGYPVVTFLRTSEEIAAVAERDPFGKPVPTGGRLYIGFLRDAPTPPVRQKIVALVESIISGATLEKVLGQPATLRNVNTVRRLAAKYPCT